MSTFAEYTKKKKKKDVDVSELAKKHSSFRGYTEEVLGVELAPIGSPVKTTVDIAPVKPTVNAPSSKPADKITSLMSVYGNKDFSSKSGYVSTKSEGIWEKLGSKYGMNYNDLQYEYINNQNDIRKEIDSKAVSWGSDTGKTSSSYKEKALDYMTEDEVAVYNYYYQTEGKDKAQEFLDALAETLNARKAGKDFESIEGKTAREILYGTVAGAEQFKQGVKGFGSMITGKDDYIPQTSTQILTGKIREDLADDGTKVFGNSLGQVVHDALSTGTNMLPSVMTGGVAGTILMGATAAGNAYQQDLNEFGDKEKARIYATTIGALEGTLQHFMGGIGQLGGTSAAISNAVSGVKNGALRFALEYGGKIGSEALEEGLQEVLDPVVKNWTHGTEESVDWENVAYSALLGGLMGGVFGATEVSSTHLNANENAVVDKVYNDTIAEREADGKKLSQKEKAKIYDETITKLEKGYIDIDTIESVIGGDTYHNYKAEVDKEAMQEADYKRQLEALKDQANTLGNAQKYQEIETKLNELKNNSKTTEIKKQLSEEVSKIVQGTKLSESYNERSRRGQNLEVDVESYKNESAKQTAQNFKDFGVNNTNASHDYLDLVTKVAEDRGHTFKFMTTKQLEKSIANGNPYNITEDASKVEAFVSGSTKEIVINMDANKSLTSLVGHEVMHTLEKANSYSDAQNALFEYAKTKGEYEDRWGSIQRRYSNLTEEQQMQELTSDLVGDYVFGDTDFIRNLSTEKPNIFKKIYNEIKYLWKMATAGSKEARELERVKREFEKIWSEAYNADLESGNISEAEEVSDSEVKFSIREEAPPKETGIAYKVFYVKDGKLYPPMVANPDGADTPMGVWLNADVGKEAAPSKTGRQQVKAGGKGTQGGSGSLAFRPGWHLGDLPRASQFDRTNPETGVKELFPKDFVWAEVEYAKDMDYQEEAMSYGYSENGKFRHAYAGLPRLPENGYYRYRTNPKPDTVPWIITGAMKVNRLLSDAEVNSILEQNGVQPVHRQGGDVGLDKFGFNDDGSVKYSIADSDGNQLTKEQHEYFANSKMRDDKGNLKVMYHGTPNDFTVFNPFLEGGKNGTQEGYGIYFTDDPKVTESYGDKKLTGYVNITHPATSYDKTIKKSDLLKLIKATTEAEAKRYVEDGDYDNIKDAIKDTWISNYVDTYSQTLDSAYREVVSNILSMNSSDMDVVNEVMGGMGVRDYKSAYEFYDILKKTIGIDGFVTEWKSDILTNGKAQIAVAFDSNQFKNINNMNPTSNSDIRYSLSEEVENVSDRLSMSEWNQVKTAVSDYTKRNYHYEKSASGDIIIPINNKLVYTDANFDSPGIRKVIEFDSEYEDEIDAARRLIYEAEKSESGISDAYEVIEDIIGYEIIHEYMQKNSSNDKRYDRRTGRGKSQSDSYHANFLQERIRRANEIISSVNQENNVEPSSEDDGFFDGKTRIADDYYTSKEYGNHIYSKDVALEGVAEIAPTTSIVEEMPIRSDYAPPQEYMSAEPEVAPVVEEVTPAAEDNERILGEDLTKKNADRIRTIQAEIKGHHLTKDITKKEFDEKIAQKESQYESLSRKDTKKAVDLRNQITRLETKRDSLLRGLDGKIERANKRIESIENESRFAKRNTKQNEYRELFGKLMGDTSTWKDKKMGIQYQTNTLRRNLRDIVRDASGNQDIARADAIYNELQGSVNRNEAKKNREANNVKNVFREMKINNAESTYIQMLGELRHNPDTTLTKEVVEEYYKKHKNKIDTDKVDKAIEEARKLYDSLYDRVNVALSEHGFKEIGYRKGYFPHFTDPKQNWLAKLLNWKVNNDEIPTDIAGLTEMFEPQRTWQSFDKHRKTDTTDYNFLKGLDNYVNGSLDWIYHIEDIQKHRAFETEIRYRHSSEQVQKKIDEYRNNPMLSAEEVDTLIQSVLREAKNPLNNFVTDLHTRTNILAGKKSSKDRNMESDFNRHAYSIMTNVTNRVTANQVVGSISSAMTNFIPITQSWGQVNPTSSLVGMKKTIQSYMSDDGVVAKSDFLTNRLAMNEALYKDAWDKIGDKVGGLMEIVDNFTSQTVWRSKYHENIKKGMTEAQAIKDADQFAENVIGGRSKGNMPTIFHAKNPVTKMLTAFQLEVANQYGYMFKDMPQDIGKKAVGKLTKGYATMFIGAYAYNALYSSLVGRDAALDPLGIIEDFIRDLGGDDDEEEDVAGAIGGLASNVADEIPFVGGLLGGGRIPISSALPYNASISDAYADVVDKDWESVLDELSKPLYYGVMPMGGGQIRKTVQGLSMFDKDLPVSGSYTKSGNLRFPVEDTFLNKLQAGVFGQYASSNAREYFDRGQKPLSEKRIQEYKDVDLPISEYWDYTEGLKGLKTLSDKADYINSLDLPIAKKNLLVNNQSEREEPIDLTDFDDEYENFDEFDFAVHNPEKYDVALKVGGYKKYKKITEGMSGMTKLSEKIEYIAGLNLSTEQKNALANSLEDRKEPFDLTGYENYDSYEEFKLATESPKKYSASRVIGYDDYSRYMDEINDIEGEKDSNGKTKNGTQKRNRRNYIFSLDLDFGQKAILYRSIYGTDGDKEEFNEDIVNYLDSRDDISHEEMVEILESLEMKMYPDGTVKW